MTTPKLPGHRPVLPGTDCSDCYPQPLDGEGKDPSWYMMRRLTLVTAVLAALIIPLGGLMAAAPALAYNVSAVYKDCEAHGQLTGHYSRAQLQAALNGMPSEVAEYSDCQVLINQALLHLSSHGGQHGNSAGGLAGGGGGSGGNGAGGSGKGSAGGGGAGTTGSSSTTGGRLTARGSGNAVTLAGSDVRPGSTGTGASGSSLPIALIVVLILLALTAVSGGAVAIRRRVVARGT